MRKTHRGLTFDVGCLNGLRRLVFVNLISVDGGIRLSRSAEVDPTERFDEVAAELMGDLADDLLGEEEPPPPDEDPACSRGLAEWQRDRRDHPEWFDPMD